MFRSEDEFERMKAENAKLEAEIAHREEMRERQHQVKLASLSLTHGANEDKKLRPGYQ